MREIKFRAWDERGEDSYGQAVTPKYIYDIQLTKAGEVVTTIIKPHEFKIEGESTYD